MKNNQNANFAEIEKNLDKFVYEENAVGFANRCNKLHMIILGDDNKYWVCRFVDATKLVEMGYELLPTWKR